MSNLSQDFVDETVLQWRTAFDALCRDQLLSRIQGWLLVEAKLADVGDRELRLMKEVVCGLHDLTAEEATALQNDHRCALATTPLAMALRELQADAREEVSAARRQPSGCAGVTIHPVAQTVGILGVVRDPDPNTIYPDWASYPCLDEIITTDDIDQEQICCHVHQLDAGLAPLRKHAAGWQFEPRTHVDELHRNRCMACARWFRLREGFLPCA